MSGGGGGGGGIGLDLGLGDFQFPVVQPLLVRVQLPVQGLHKLEAGREGNLGDGGKLCRRRRRHRRLVLYSVHETEDVVMPRLTYARTFLGGGEGRA